MGREGGTSTTFPTQLLLRTACLFLLCKEIWEQASSRATRFFQATLCVSSFRSPRNRMEEFLQSISASSGFPVDQLKYLACLLLLAPLAVPFRALHNVTLKHLYSVIVSFLMLWFCLGAESFAHSFGTSLVCYLILLYVPHKHAYKVVFAVS